MAEKGSFKYIDPRVCFCVHENVLLAYLNYAGDAEEFQQMMREGKDGHNDDYDEYMKQIAEERTAQPGWRYEKSKRRK